MSGRIWHFLKTYFAVLVVAGAYGWATFSVVTTRRARAPEGTQVELRIGHWQLEAGVRDALDHMAAEYSRLHPGVRIVQDAIPESTYGQWMTTQMMGGTAPDMIEVGMGVPYNVMLGFHSRYFLPLTAYVNQPNPYNKGTDLESVPWRSTYKDAMRMSYVEELQEYMLVPLAQFGVRVFYNKTLLKRLTGVEQAPSDLGAFIALCERIKTCRDERGRPYTPIAGSAYHIGMWDGNMCEPLTYGAVRRADFNRDGAVGNDELYVAIETGLLDFDFPPFAAKFKMLREITRQCQPGFTGLGRDEAVFLFAQQRAVFISTGSWDAGSLLEQAQGSFEIGIMGFPIPARDDPQFGAVWEGRVYERPQASFPFAITRTSRHPEVALDFLMFLGSRKGNEELNRIIGWIPAIDGTSISPMLKTFAPNLDGVYGAMPVTLGGETIIKWQQLYSLFQVGQIDYAQLAAEFVPFYREKGVEEYQEMWRNRRRGVVRDEQFLTGMRSRALSAGADGGDAVWVPYRQITASRLLYRDLPAVQLERRLRTGREPDAAGPYEFRPEVLEKVRARLHANTGRR